MIQISSHQHRKKTLFIPLTFEGLVLTDAFPFENNPAGKDGAIFDNMSPPRVAAKFSTDCYSILTDAR